MIVINQVQGGPNASIQFGDDGSITLISPLPVTLPAGTPGSVLFAGNNAAMSQDNANFFWDNTVKSLRVGPAAGITDILGLGTNTPQKIGISHGTAAARVNNVSPSIVCIRHDQTLGAGTLNSYFLGTIVYNGATKPAYYNVIGYIASDDASVAPKDICGVIGFSVANPGSTSSPRAFYGEATINNQNTAQVCVGSEIRVVNAAADAPALTTLISNGSTLGYVAVGRGFKNTVAYHIQSVDGLASAFKTGINIGLDVIDKAGYGIDFKYAGTSYWTTGAALRLASAMPIVARKADDSANFNLIQGKFYTDDLVTHADHVVLGSNGYTIRVNSDATIVLPSKEIGALHIVPTRNLNGAVCAITFGGNNEGGSISTVAVAGIYGFSSGAVGFGSWLQFGTTNNYAGGVQMRLEIDPLGNFGFNGTSYGGGQKVIFIANATVVPSSNPAGGGVLYVEAGALKYRGSAGTITPIAPA